MGDLCVACRTNERADGWTKCRKCLEARLAAEKAYREGIEKGRKENRKRMEMSRLKSVLHADAEEQIGSMAHAVRILEDG